MVLKYKSLVIGTLQPQTTNTVTDAPEKDGEVKATEDVKGLWFDRLHSLKTGHQIRDLPVLKCRPRQR